MTGPSRAIGTPGVPTEFPTGAIPYRTAGRATLLSVGMFGLSAVALALYFGDVAGIFGPINDVLIALAILLLLPAVAAVRRLSVGRVGGWFAGMSVLAAVGIAVASGGQLLLVAGLLSLEGSFVTLGVGGMLLVAWAGSHAILALRTATLPRSVGWWALALVGIVGVTAVTMPFLSLGTAALSVVFGIPILVALVGWLVALGRALSRQA